jgi:hypothetical protein
LARTQLQVCESTRVPDWWALQLGYASRIHGLLSARRVRAKDPSRMSRKGHIEGLGNNDDGGFEQRRCRSVGGASRYGRGDLPAGGNIFFVAIVSGLRRLGAVVSLCLSLPELVRLLLSGQPSWADDSFFSLRFFVPLVLSLLGLKRFWTRAVRSNLGAHGVLVYTLRSFRGMWCWVNTLRSFEGVRLLVLAYFLVSIGFFALFLYLFL